MTRFSIVLVIGQNIIIIIIHQLWTMDSCLHVLFDDMLTVTGQQIFLLYSFV